MFSVQTLSKVTVEPMPTLYFRVNSLPSFVLRANSPSSSCDIDGLLPSIAERLNLTLVAINFGIYLIIELI